MDLATSAAPARPHSLFTRITHWVAAALLVFAYVDNGDVTRALFNPAAMRMEVWVGVACAVVFGILFVSAWLGGGSRLPKQAPAWERVASRIAHWSLYGLLAAILATGGLIAYLAPSATILRRGAVLTDSSLLNTTIAVHDATAQAIVWVAGIHILGALWHWVVRRDGVMEAMTAARLALGKRSA